MARYNNRRNQNVRRGNVAEELEPTIEYKRMIRDDEDLIIEEKTVYEIDSECYERVRRARLSSRKNELK